MSIYKPGRPAKYNPNTGQGNKPPSAPGEYRIRDGAGKVVYVGETNDLNRRMNEHKRNGKFN
jgi:excinuclease UvrABC nuclease subunit